MSTAASALRRSALQAPKLVRNFSNSKQSLGGHDADHYIHATHMYEIQSIKNRPLKYGAGILVLVSGGLGIPFFAIHWQKAKSAGV